ncbi:MAG: hypothetical protein WCO63_16740, partial [Bacteroidota bacterium]
MIKKIKKLIWNVDGIEFPDNPVGEEATFRLTFGTLLIGILTYHQDIWTFEYSNEFRKNGKINPIIDFPDITKEYTSAELWPFFAARIPALNQPYQFKKIARAKANRNDSVA